MKSIFITALLGLGTIVGANAQEFSEKATYIGYDEDFKTYSFEAEDGDYLEFSKVSPTIVSKYKLMDKSVRGQAFLLGYDISASEDEYGDVIEILSIIKMSLTTIVKKEEEEEEEDDDF